jgi:modulator of FtsH protease HflK
MRADYLSFARATSRSLLGLAIQFVLGLVLLGCGLWVKDASAMTAAGFVLLGVPVWLTLAILYDQHRRERIEAIEAESFAASDAATSSVFDQGEELRVAHKRLRAMYRFFVPAVSLIVAAALVGVGIWRFNLARGVLERFSQGGLPAEELAKHLPLAGFRGWAIAAGVAVAFVGFLFARYISGMAKEKVWANLRGGAGFAVGSALFGLAIALGHFMVGMGASPLIPVYLALAFPVFLVALGGEIFLNFLFEMYRPRKAGEMPRPAFESWLLGLVAAPDRIAQRVGEALNYQFGYDVSGSWFYQLLSRTALRVLLPVAIIVVWGLTALVVIRPHERAMVLRFGQYVRDLEPGLHVKYPWPIERVEVPLYTRKNAQGRIEFTSRTVTGVRSVDVGTPPPTADKPILWGNDHALEEVFFLVQPEKSIALSALARASLTEGEQPRAASGDLAMVAAEIPLHYSVEDVRAYELLAPPEMRDDLLKTVAQRAVMRYFATLTVGDMLGGRRAELQDQVRKYVERAFVELNPLQNGQPVVKVLYVGLQGVHPPKDTVMAFEQVVGAEQKYQARLKDAEGTAIKTLTMAAGSVEIASDIIREMDKLESMPSLTDGKASPEVVEQQLKVRQLIQSAQGQAGSLILQASADRWGTHMGARTRLSAYQGQLGTYRAAPALYRAGLYLDALKESIAQARVFIVDPAAELTIRGDFQDRDSQLNIFDKQNN